MSTPAPASVSTPTPASTLTRSTAFEGWTSQNAAALERAKKEDKVVLLAFIGSDWCDTNLKEEVFDSMEFKDWALSRAVLIQCDFPHNTVLDEATKKQNDALMHKFGITSLPQVVVLDSSGEKIGQLGYYEKGGASYWTLLCDDLLTKAKGKSVVMSLGDDWTTNYSKAVERAKKENKALIMAFMASDWCMWCRLLKKQIFDTQEFKDWAASRAVLVVCDFPENKVLDRATKEQNDALMQKFGVTGFPAILAFNSSGEKLGQLSWHGTNGPSYWIKMSNAVLQKGKSKPADGWTTHYTQAMERAKKEDKALVLSFTASDWSEPCKKLKADVFDTQEFRNWAPSRVVLVECDFPHDTELDDATKIQNEALSRQFGITGCPTVIVLSSSGEKLGELGCFASGGASYWIKMCDALLPKAKGKSITAPATPAAPDAPAKPKITKYLLKDGRTIEALLSMEADDNYVLKTDSGMQTIKKEDVVEINKP